MPGRRGARVEDHGRWVFNRLAGAYASRPGYPAPLIDRLVALAGPGGRTVDLGAGTGHLTLPLASRGLRVAAVEPAREMLESLRRGAEREPGASAVSWSSGSMDQMGVDARARAATLPLQMVHAPAESTGLPASSFDLAVVADALHWLDPELAGREIARLRAPGGAVAVVEVELLDSPFLDALWPRLQAANPKARPRALDLSGARTHLFALAAPGAEVRTELFECEDALDPAAAAAVVASLSFVGPALSPAEVESLTGWAARRAETDGASWRRRLHLRWAR